MPNKEYVRPRFPSGVSNPKAAHPVPELPDVDRLSIQQRVELMRWCADSLAGVAGSIMDEEDHLYIFHRLKRRNQE